MYTLNTVDWGAHGLEGNRLAMRRLKQMQAMWSGLMAACHELRTTTIPRKLWPSTKKNLAWPSLMITVYTEEEI